MTDIQDILDISAEAMRVERERCLAAVDDEPELPGDMPTEMAEAIAEAIKTADVDFFVDAMRLAVRMTKAGIRERIISG